MISISWPYLAAFALLCLATVWFCSRLLRRGGSSSAWQEAQREPEYGANALVPDMTEHAVDEPVPSVCVARASAASLPLLAASRRVCGCLLECKLSKKGGG